MQATKRGKQPLILLSHATNHNSMVGYPLRSNSGTHTSEATNNYLVGLKTCFSQLPGASEATDVREEPTTTLLSHCDSNYTLKLILIPAENHNWSKCRDQLIMGCPAPVGPSTTQLLH